MIFKITPDCLLHEARSVSMELGKDLVERFERAQIETFCMLDPVDNLLVNVLGNSLQLQAVGSFLRKRYGQRLLKPTKLDRLSLKASLAKAQKAHAQEQKRKIIQARFIPVAHQSN